MHFPVRRARSRRIPGVNPRAGGRRCGRCERPCGQMTRAPKGPRGHCVGLGRRRFGLLARLAVLRERLRLLGVDQASRPQGRVLLRERLGLAEPLERARGRLRLGPLGRLERCQLLLGRQVAALGDDEGLHLGRHPLEHVDRDAEAADPLDHVEVDLAAVDADLPRPPELLLGDVGRRDRAEERTCRAGLDLNAGWSSSAWPRSPRPGRTSAASWRAACRSGDLGDAPGVATSASRREQVVAGVPALDVDDVALEADLLDVAGQDDFHHAPARTAGAPSRGPA